MSGSWPFDPLKRGRYRVILADPPWNFRAWSPRGDGRSASQHYRVMTLPEIKALPVSELAAPDCALFLWVYQPMLPQALEVIEAWGFKFKSVAYVWVKIKGMRTPLFIKPGDFRMGLGYHTRSGIEQCWLATRGKGYVRQSKAERQVLVAPIREHSRKPDEIAQSIVRLTGDVPRVELFARTRREGWDYHGLETGRFK